MIDKHYLQLVIHFKESLEDETLEEFLERPVELVCVFSTIHDLAKYTSVFIEDLEARLLDKRLIAVRVGKLYALVEPD